jgi:hypothetical protein
MGVNLPTQGLWHFAVECLQVCIARPILSVKEHMYSRLLPAPILAPAKGAGPPWQRPLCDPDPQARRLQARRGSGSGDGPVARQPRPGCAPTQQCVWPAALMITCAQAQLIMLLAALHQTSDTFLHSPHDALPSSFPRTPASAIMWPHSARGTTHSVINSTPLNQLRCSILSFAPPSPPPSGCQTCSVRSEVPA